MNPFDLRALARPACPPPRCPLCSTFAQQYLFVSIQGIGLLLLLTLTLRPSPSLAARPPSVSSSAAAPATRGVGGNRVNQAQSLRHVLVEVQVVLLVELIESLGKVRIQLRPRVRRPVVGSGADVLDDVVLDDAMTAANMALLAALCQRSPERAMISNVAGASRRMKDWFT